MADADKDILITPATGDTAEPTIVFTGQDNAAVTLRVLDDGTVSFEGTSGQLFSVSDDLTGTIFSVNDISGIPSIEVLADGTVKLAEYGGSVLLGSSGSIELGSGGPTITTYAGNPENNVTADKGSLVLRTDATGESIALYVKGDDGDASTWLPVAVRATSGTNEIYRSASGGALTSTAGFEFDGSNFATPDITTTGDASIGGDLTVDRTGDADAAELVLTADAGQWSSLRLKSGGTRWHVGRSATAESGSDAGSDFVFQRYSDAGSFLGAPLTITRATGDATFAADVTVGGDLEAQGSSISHTSAASNAQVLLDGVAGGESRVFLRSGTSNRWNIRRNGATADSLDIARYPAGSFVANAVSIDNDDGSITTESDVTVGGDLELGSGGPTVSTGTGSPEGVVTAEVGSTYHRDDGSSGTTLYTKASGSGNTGWEVVGTGAGGGSTTYAFESHTTAGQSIPDATWTTITDLTATDDPQGMESAGEVTIPVDGFYQFSANVVFAQEALGYRYVRLFVNSATEVARNWIAPITGTTMPISVAWVGYLEQGDTVEFQVYQTSGSALALATAGTIETSTRWGGAKVGATQSANARSITSVSSTYTAAASDDIVLATSGTFTVTLPTAVGNTGLGLTVQNSGTGVITLDGDGSETINGLANLTLDQWDAISVVSDGSNWFIGPGGGTTAGNRTVAEKTTTYTATTNDDIILCTSGTWTLTLPTAVGNIGLELHVTNSGTGVITLDGDGSETISGDTTQTLNQWDSVEVVSDGSNWVII